MGLLSRVRKLGAALGLAASLTVAAASAAYAQSSYTVPKGATPTSIARQTLPDTASAATIDARIREIQRDQPGIFGRDLGYTDSQGSYQREPNKDGLGDEIGAGTTVDLSKYQPVVPEPDGNLSTSAQEDGTTNTALVKQAPNQQQVVAPASQSAWSRAKQYTRKTMVGLLAAATLASAAYGVVKVKEGLDNYHRNSISMQAARESFAPPSTDYFGQVLEQAGAERIMQVKTGTNGDTLQGNVYRIQLKRKWYEAASFQFVVLDQEENSTVALPSTGNSMDDRFMRLAEYHNRNVAKISYALHRAGFCAAAITEHLNIVAAGYEAQYQALLTEKEAQEKASKQALDTRTKVQQIINFHRTDVKFSQEKTPKRPMRPHPWDLPLPGTS